jgi:hypothetical protein
MPVPEHCWRRDHRCTSWRYRIGCRNELHDLRRESNRRHSDAAGWSLRSRNDRAPGYELVKEEGKNILLGDA